MKSLLKLPNLILLNRQLQSTIKNMQHYLECTDVKSNFEGGMEFIWLIINRV